MEDEIQVYTTLIELDEIEVYTTLMELNEMDWKKKPSIEVGYNPYPTLSPSLSPLVAMLAASIHGIQDGEILNKKGIPKAGTSQIPRTEGWKAAFLAGSRSGAVGKVNSKVISKAQLERLLRKPLALHRRDLPPPPTKHSDLERAPNGAPIRAGGIGPSEKP